MVHLYDLFNIITLHSPVYEEMSTYHITLKSYNIGISDPNLNLKCEGLLPNWLM
jgi:hypothetical protein